MRRSLFPVLVSLIAASSLNGQEVDRALILEEFDIPTDGDTLAVPVVVEDKRFMFVVDTGASWTQFDSSLRSLLRPPLKTKSVKTPLGSVPIEFHPFPRIQVGRMPVAVNGTVACVPLGDVRKVAGQELFGFLGMDVLSQYVVRLDFDRGKLTFLKEVGHEEGMRVSLDHSRVPVLPLRLHGMRPLPFLIDTGSIGVDSGMLNSSLVSWMEENEFMTIVGKRKAIDLSQTSWVRQGLVGRCSFAGHECTNTLWSEASENAPSHLSLHFLTQFNVTFDFPNAVMYLTKSKHFGRADGVDLSGLHFRRVNGRVVIAVVDQGSSAEACGVQTGDVIKMVGDQDASTARLFVLRESLCQPGATIRMVLERGTETFERELVLPGLAVARKSEPAEAPR